MAVSGVGQTGNTSSASSFVYNPKSELGKTDFLQMLVTKLKYQDPLKPVSDESFIADMAQFSSLEQMTNLNTTFGSQSNSLNTLNENLLALIIMQNTTQAAGLIGKTVVLNVPQTNVLTGETETVTIEGHVDSIKFVDGMPKVIVNGTQYDLPNVTEIKA